MTVYRSPVAEKAVLERYDSLLASWPIPYETNYFMTRHGITHVIICGNPDGVPLVMQHGHSTNATVWKMFVPRFAPYFRLYLPDMIGQPGKSYPETPRDRYTGYVEWMDDLLTAMGLTQTDMFGGSLGGWITLHMAYHHPERIRRALAMVPAGIVAPDFPRIVRVALPAVSKLPLGMVPTAREFVERVGMKNVEPEVADSLALAIGSSKPALINPPVLPDNHLQNLQVPVMIVAAKYDQLFSGDRIRERLGRVAPQIPVIVIEDAGHLVRSVALDGYMDKIHTFLA